MSTLGQIDADPTQFAANAGAQLHSFQCNHEDTPIDRIHAARDDGTGHIVINAGGLTHTSLRTTAVT
jgi:3-dehydroquinate dehydratase-2